jgi:lysophospholipase L1-like esterase
MLRRALFPLVLVLLSSLLALLAAEGIVRALGLGGAVRAHFRPGIFRADPGLGWALSPGYRGVRLEDHSRVPTTTNALGFRGPEWDATRLGSELRVLVLGDSCTFGLGVADDETFPAQLESLLRARGVEAAVFNAGVPGYNTAREALVFERLADRVQPQLVIVTWLPNDALPPLEYVEVRDGYLVKDVERYEKWRNRIDNRGLSRSALYRFVRIRGRILRERIGARDRAWQEKLRPAALRASTDALQRIDSRSREIGAETLLVLLPRREQLDGSLASASLAHVAAFARARGMRVVDLLQIWSEAAVDTRALFLNDNVHLNAQGYREMARVVADATAAQTGAPLAIR